MMNSRRLLLLFFITVPIFLFNPAYASDIKKFLNNELSEKIKIGKTTEAEAFAYLGQTTEKNADGDGNIAYIWRIRSFVYEGISFPLIVKIVFAKKNNGLANYLYAKANDGTTNYAVGVGPGKAGKRSYQHQALLKDDKDFMKFIK